jgi:hypothetical protein
METHKLGCWWPVRSGLILFMVDGVRCYHDLVSRVDRVEETVALTWDSRVAWDR